MPKLFIHFHTDIKSFYLIVFFLPRGNFFDAKNVDINISHDKPEKKML
jgi:hypothetical protein